MSKFRSSHKRKGKRASQSYISRSVLYIIFLGIILMFLYNLISNLEGTEYDTFNPAPNNTSRSSNFYLPEGSRGQLIHHDHYSLSYNEEKEQSDWVAYKLTRESLKVPNVKRSRQFYQDSEVRQKSAHHKDYSNSGYTRGHMAPAGDMAFDKEAMRQTFFMSNMSPQIKACNNGVWKELEETVRDWAYKEGELYIVSGPIFDSHIYETIGWNKVAVPDRFFKVILDLEGKNQKGIAFVVENAASERLLSNHAVSIDEVELITGFDFLQICWMIKKRID